MDSVGLKKLLIVGLVLVALVALLAIGSFVYAQKPPSQTTVEIVPVNRYELNAPQHRVTFEDLTLENETRLILNSDKPLRFGRTHGTSMLPLFGDNTPVLLADIKTEDIKVGDFIVYRFLDSTLVMHRVMVIGTDEYGWYARMKGINNSREDILPVRASQVDSVVIAVFW